MKFSLSRRTAVVLAAVVVAIALPLAIYLFGVAASGPDRAALARSREKTYWLDVGHAKWKDAYSMLTPGIRQQTSLAGFAQGFMNILQQTAGIYETTGRIDINGDFAVATVNLRAPRVPGGVFTRYQHLFWDGSNWYISDTGGGLSNTR